MKEAEESRGALALAFSSSECGTETVRIYYGRYERPEICLHRARTQCHSANRTSPELFHVSFRMVFFFYGVVVPRRTLGFLITSPDKRINFYAGGILTSRHIESIVFIEVWTDAGNHNEDTSVRNTIVLPRRSIAFRFAR